MSCLLHYICKYLVYIPETKTNYLSLMQDGEIWTFSVRAFDSPWPDHTISVNYEGFAEGHISNTHILDCLHFAEAFIFDYLHFVRKKKHSLS